LLEQLNDNSKPRLVGKARLRYEEVRQVNLLLLPERVVKLNSTGASILTLCDGTRTVREIVQMLQAEYKQADLESEVLEFLCRVFEQGWIE
jgi:pyrroloquinoline quinone biosynthesis protein D